MVTSNVCLNRACVYQRLSTCPFGNSTAHRKFLYENCPDRALPTKNEDGTASPIINYPESFWMVLRESGGTAPTVRHSSKAEAIAEAGRLVKKHPGHRFFVLQSICEVTTTEPEAVITSHYETIKGRYIT